MSICPEYIHRMLERARDEGQWHAAQADAAAICFDVLTLFPDCEEAQELVYELFCDEWMLYDNRVAIQQTFYLPCPAKWNALHGPLHAGSGHLLLTSLAAYPYIRWHDRIIEYLFNSPPLLGSYNLQ